MCDHQICILERAQYDRSTTNLYMPPKSNIFWGKHCPSTLRLLKGAHRRKDGGRGLKRPRGAAARAQTHAITITWSAVPSCTIMWWHVTIRGREPSCCAFLPASPTASGGHLSSQVKRLFSRACQKVSGVRSVSLKSPLSRSGCNTLIHALGHT